MNPSKTEMYPNIIYNGIRDGEFSIVIRLLAGHSGVPIPVGTEVCLFSKNAHTVPEIPLNLLLRGNGDCYPGVKWPDLEGNS